MMPGVTIYNSAPPASGIKQVPMGAILAQHRKRYVYHSALGDIVLRHIRFVEMQEVGIEAANDPDLSASMNAVGPLFAKLKGGGELTPQENAEMMRHNAVLMRLTHKLAVKCIESPALADVGEFEALLDVLPPKDRDGLNLLLSALVQEPTDDINASIAALAKEFGIPLTGDLTLETMTLDQVRALEGVLDKQATMERRAIQGAM